MKDCTDNASPEHAVAYLRRCGVDAEQTDYGFRILHPELSDRTFADCGMDNDSSISLSVNTDESPPVIWFFRKDYLEMADFLVASFNIAGGPVASRAGLVAAMRRLNQDYDNTELKKITEAFLEGLVEDE